MRINVLIFPALVAVGYANPIDSSAVEDLFVRDEYRWCLGTTRTKLHLPVRMD